MSQDQSPISKATDQKSGQGQGHDSTPVGTSAGVSASISAAKQQSRIDEPIDALRAGMTNNQTVTKTDTPEQAGAMKTNSDSKSNNNSDTKTDTTVGNKADTKVDTKPEAKADTKTTGNPASTATGSGSGSTRGSGSGSVSAAPAGKKSGGVFTGLILGLVLVAIALGVGLWWQQQRFEAVAKEIATRLQQTDQQLAQATQKATQALTLATTQRDIVDQLSRELSVTSNELKTLQQAWEAANEGLDQTLLLNDLKRLIAMANQELVLFGNVTSAVSILSSVDSMLATQSAPALKNLQQAVITDLARLRSVPQVDVANLSARLDSLIQLTGKAPLLSPAGNTAARPNQPPQKTPPAEAGTAAVPSSASPSASPNSESTTGTETPWWSSWDQATGKVSAWTSEASAMLMREFADVMSIRKADDPQALLLSEEQAIQLKANVRAMLLSAQLALMTRQPDIWRSELSEVQSILNTRYDTQALDTKASLNLLRELLDAPVASEVPKITATLSALASAERSLSIPPEAESTSPTTAPDPAADSATQPESTPVAAPESQTTVPQTPAPQTPTPPTELKNTGNIGTNTGQGN